MFPDDPKIEELNDDPMMKAWMFYNWLEDYSDEYKLLENQGYLIASFSHPDAVKKALGIGADQYATTDEEFERTSREILENNNKIDEEKTRPTRKRRRKIIDG